MGITYKELTSNGIVSQKTIDILPVNCRCGSNLIFSESLRELVCGNDDCKYGLIRRFYMLCKRLGVTLRYEDVIEIVTRLEIKSPFQVFYLQEAYDTKFIDDSIVPDIKKHLEEIEQSKLKEYRVWEILVMSGEPGIPEIANAVAYGFSSVTELYREIENGQLAFINERLGIESLDSCIFSIDIYNKLLKIKDEMIFAEQMLKIKEYKNKIYIAFNDSVYPFLNSQECIQKLGTEFDKTFVHIGTISENTDILIKNTTTSSQKYRAAMLINDAYAAELVNKGEIELQDIGVRDGKSLKPVGHKIYIDSLDNVRKRLKELVSEGYK